MSNWAFALACRRGTNADRQGIAGHWCLTHDCEWLLSEPICAARLASAEDAERLDEAWAEAEAALPEGWAILELHHTAMMDQRWRAEAQSRIGPVVQWNKVRTVIAEGLTPALALRALAERLRR